jgi:hypothetical protein
LRLKEDLQIHSIMRVMNCPSRGSKAARRNEMKLTKILFGVTVVAAALTALAGSASATTLETNGVKKTEAISFEATSKGSWLMQDTSGAFLNTCLNGAIGTKDSTAATGTTVSGPITRLVIGSLCTHTAIVIDKPGSLSIEWIKGTTNGTVRLNGTEWTLPMTIFGSVVTARCTTNNTDVGTFTGAGAGGTSTLDFNGVLDCGQIFPSTKWVGTFTVTGGHAIGVVE